MKLRFKTFGLCAVVLGVMAFTAGSAQAAPPAWMVNGSDISETLLPSLKAALENNTASLLTTILGQAVKILCTSLHITNKLGFAGKVDLGKVIFLGCKTFLEGSSTASTPCLPKTGGVDDVIESKNGEGSLALVLENVPEVLIKPDVEGPLAVVESSAECAVGQKINITGEIILKDCEGSKLTAEQVTHLVEVDNFHSKLKASGQAASIDGSANVSLSGVPHEGLSWSGLPV